MKMNFKIPFAGPETDGTQVAIGESVEVRNEDVTNLVEAGIAEIEGEIVAEETTDEEKPEKPTKKPKK